MVEQQFNVTSKTAKRDLNELIRLQQIRFVRIPRPGHYELQRRNAKRSEPADPKVQIAQGGEAEQRATRRTLIRTLETVLRLLHPIAPFITAELWETVAPVAGRKTTETVVTAPYPQAQLEKVDPAADAWVAQLKQLLSVVRNLRSEMGLAPGERVPLLTLGDAAFVSAAAPLARALARLSEVKVFDDEAAFDAATQIGRAHV